MSTTNGQANARTLPKPGTKQWKNFAKWANAEFASASAEKLARLKPPSNDEWDQMKRSNLVSLRLAHRMLEIDKATHVAALNALTGEESAELFEGVLACADRFRSLADLADAAIERLLCAGAKAAADRTLAQELALPIHDDL